MCAALTISIADPMKPFLLLVGCHLWYGIRIELIKAMDVTLESGLPTCVPCIVSKRVTCFNHQDFAMLVGV